MQKYYFRPIIFKNLKTVKISSFHIIFICLVFFAVVSCRQSSRNGVQTSSEIADTEEYPAFEGWELLTDKDTLSRWEIIQYGGEGTPYMKGQTLVLPMAVNGTLTGVRWAGDSLPVNNYMVAFEAQRTEGHDFFAGLTFSCNDTQATLIIGGWAGSTCGLSSIDGYDASENETTTFIHFKENQWYPVLLRVTPDSIRAMVDTVKVVDIATAGRRIHLRGGTQEVSLGLSTYLTTGEIRYLRLKRW